MVAKPQDVFMTEDAFGIVTANAVVERLDLRDCSQVRVVPLLVLGVVLPRVVSNPWPKVSRRRYELVDTSLDDCCQPGPDVRLERLRNFPVKAMDGRDMDQR